MIRLVAVKTSIVALRRAVSLSVRRKPASWEFFALGCATAFFLFALILWESIESGPQPIINVSNNANAINTKVIDVSAVRVYFHVVSRSDDASNLGHAELDNAIAEMNKHYAGNWALSHRHQDKVYLFNYDHHALGDCAGFVWKVYRDRNAPASVAKPLIMASAIERDLMWLDLTRGKDGRLALQMPSLPDPMRFFRSPPTVVFQSVPESDNGFRKEVSSWVLLFGSIVSPIVSLGMMLLAWIGHHRKRAEEALLLLELEKRRLEIEKLKSEVEMMRQEVNKPRIILS